MLTLIKIYLDTVCSLLTKKTEGFLPKDLQSLLGRAFHRAVRRKMKNLTGNEVYVQNVTTAF